MLISDGQNLNYGDRASPFSVEWFRTLFRETFKEESKIYTTSKRERYSEIYYLESDKKQIKQLNDVSLNREEISNSVQWLKVKNLRKILKRLAEKKRNFYESSGKIHTKETPKKQE